MCPERLAYCMSRGVQRKCGQVVFEVGPADQFFSIVLAASLVCQWVRWVEFFVSCKILPESTRTELVRSALATARCDADSCLEREFRLCCTYLYGSRALSLAIWLLYGAKHDHMVLCVTVVHFTCLNSVVRDRSCCATLENNTSYHAYAFLCQTVHMSFFFLFHYFSSPITHA